MGETTADGPTGDETTAGGAACEPAPDQTSDCCCFANYTDSVFIENSCAAPALCPSLVITCSWDDPECPTPRLDGSPMGSADVFEVNDEAALECVLQALRDGTPGTLSWSFTEFTTPGQYARDVIQHVAADRVVFATSEDVLDQGGVVADATQQTLMPPEHFDECLQGDVRTRALCLTATTDGAISATCAMGGPYNNF